MRPEHMHFMTNAQLEPVLLTADPAWEDVKAPAPSTPAGRNPLLYRFGDLCLQVLSGLSGMAAYLALALAAFAAACAVYATWWIPFDTGSFGTQFLWLAGYLCYYVAAPLVLLTCLWYVPWGLWRAMWERPSIFEEKRVHPAVISVLAVMVAIIAYQAHMSLEGDWRQLPVRIGQVLDMPGGETRSLLPERFVHADQPQSPALIAEPGTAGLATISADAPRLRAVQLAESLPHGLSPARRRQVP